VIAGNNLEEEAMPPGMAFFAFADPKSSHSSREKIFQSPRSGVVPVENRLCHRTHKSENGGVARFGLNVNGYLSSARH
jgi:hypothetical protein